MIKNYSARKAIIGAIWWPAGHEKCVGEERRGEKQAPRSA
jgi:hypothetical protein